VLCDNMSGYEFVNQDESNINRYGIHIDKGEDEYPLFLGKVIYKDKEDKDQRKIGRLYGQYSGISCFIEADEEQEIVVSDGVQILHSKS